MLVTQDGFLKVIDFGIARTKGQARHGVLPGKLSYMSPEQAARKIVDHRSDIFSLGIVLYEITVGRRLFRGPASEVVGRLVEAQVEPPTFARRNFPPALEAIVMRALEKHPEDRYQTAYDLADDLESFLRDDKLHSGPVRIARYLDMLAITSGGARRPELISEAEARQGAGDELDFDSQVFDSFEPSEGAPGPEQAPLWEDVEQNEAEVAAALHLELAELRALRTPVPTRPSGMKAVTGASAIGLHEVEDELGVTIPVPRMKTAEIYGDEDGGDDPDAGIRTTTPIARPTPISRPSTRPPEPEGEPARSDHRDPGEPSGATPTVTTSQPPEPTPAPASSRSLARTPAPATLDAPQFGAAFLARSAPSRLPWVLVATLGMAVLGLVAYIVIR